MARRAKNSTGVTVSAAASTADYTAARCPAVFLALGAASGPGALAARVPLGCPAFRRGAGFFAGAALSVASSGASMAAG